MFLPRKILEKRLNQILAEDIGQGDITTSLTIPMNATAEAEISVKERGVIAGMEESKVLLESLGLEVKILVVDGEPAEAGTVLMRILGSAQTILTVERTVLNIISRMSGIATATKRLVDKIRKMGLKTRVASTRKVAPGLLYFDKKAVLMGGGDTHRVNLHDLILIKDNHLALTKDLEGTVKRAKKAGSFSKKIEVEVTNSKEALEAATAGADIVMLDNFSPVEARRTVEMLSEKGFIGKVIVEASGGITAENILEYARTGVNIVSLGEITHSVKALDMSLEIVDVGTSD